MPSPFRSALLWLIVISTACRLCWAAGLETGNDEGYHYLYLINPDWSYFDHPPMLMWLSRVGVALCGGWVHPLSLRLGFVMLFAGSTWVMFEWTARWYDERAGFYAALALNLSAFYSVAAGAFVLPDGPFLFFALLTMWRLSEALVGSPGRILPWVWVGLACAGAMLSKYHAIFLPLGALVFVIATPSARRSLWTPGPYLAALIALLGLIPVIIWNSNHDWASFVFQGMRAIGGRFRPDGLVVLLFGPIGFLFPWIWFPLISIFAGRISRFRSLTGHERLLMCLSMVPLVFFLGVSFVRPILPHWPLIGFVPLYPMVGAAWAARSESEPLRVHRFVVGMSVALLVLAGTFLTQARFGVIEFPFRDPCIEISGWGSLGRELVARGIVDRPNTFLFTNRWFDSGQLAFAVRNRVPVLCYHAGDARGFAFWSRPEDWIGKDGVLIEFEDRARSSRTDYEPYFRQIEQLPSMMMRRGEHPFRTVRVYLCSEQWRPFPFNYPSRCGFDAIHERPQITATPKILDSN